MTAFRATFSDLKVVKTRQVAQLVFEIPLSEFDGAYEILGGLPNPAIERWVAIAAIKESAAPSCAVAKPQPVPDKPQAGAKRDWRDLPPAQQAGIRCAEPSFWEFLREERALDWQETKAWDGVTWVDHNHAAECVRLICGVSSRSELNTNQKARVIWHQLNDQYEAWIRICA